MRREKIFYEAVGELGEERKKERERGAVEKDADLIPRLVLHERLLFLSVKLEEDDETKILTHPDLVHVAYRAIRR